MCVTIKASFPFFYNYLFRTREANTHSWTELIRIDENRDGGLTDQEENSGGIFTGREIDTYLGKLTGSQGILCQSATRHPCASFRLSGMIQMAAGTANTETGTFVVSTKIIDDGRQGGGEVIPI